MKYPNNEQRMDPHIDRQPNLTDRVRIVWEGQGGELGSIVVKDDGDQSVTNALIELIKGNIVAAGDSFKITAI